MRSFAFPRNEVGHLKVLKEFGFLCYRGVEPNWYENRRVPEKLQRAIRVFEVLRAAQAFIFRCTVQVNYAF